MAQHHVVLRSRRRPPLHLLLLLAMLLVEFCMVEKSFLIVPMGAQRSVSVARLATEASELQLAQELRGKVKSLNKWGAKIDLGLDVPGFLHVKNICEERIKVPADRLSKGQEVNVFVLKVKGYEVEVSMVPLTGKSKSLSEFHEGDEIEGKIESVLNNVLFIDVGTHNSAVLERDDTDVEDLKTVFKPGQSITAKVLWVAPTEIRLTMK